MEQQLKSKNSGIGIASFTISILAGIITCLVTVGGISEIASWRQAGINLQNIGFWEQIQHVSIII